MAGITIRSDQRTDLDSGLIGKWLKHFSKSLVRQPTHSAIVKLDAKTGIRPEASFHMPDTESIVAQILKWQNDDDYSQAGIKYCKDGEHPEKPYLQKWIKTVGVCVTFFLFRF